MAADPGESGAIKRKRLSMVGDKCLASVSDKEFKRGFSFFFNAEGWRGCSTNMLSALDSSDGGNNQDRTHLLVKPFRFLPVGFVSDRYQSSVVLRMAAIRSRGSIRLSP